MPVLPRISNHSDFDALRAHPEVDLRFIGPDQPLPACDLIVLPGSKSTRADLAWLRVQEWDRAIARHLRYGGKVIGLCGGLQMLGHAVHDPLGVEGEAGSSAGLGWLNIETMLQADKQLRQVHGRLAWDDAAVRGYEIHCGHSTGAGLDCHFCTLDDGRRDGARSGDGQVIGTYLHGVFDEPAALASLLRWAGLADATPLNMQALREASLERLADAVEDHLDVHTLSGILEIPCKP